MSKVLCPFGSMNSYRKCCEVFIRGQEQPATAEELMRSRYSAFVTGAVAYLVDTQHPDFRRADEAVGISAWMLEVNSWDGLEVLVCQDGESSDTLGWVAFNVKFTRGNRSEIFHECSRFRKVNGR